MHLQSAISIGPIGYFLGDQLPIDTLVSDVLEEGEVLTLQALGVAYFTKTSKSHLEMLSMALSSCLSEGGVLPGDIDQIMISSHTFSAYDFHFSGLIGVLKGHGIKNVPITSLYMSRCSSAITCIRHAVNQIQTEDGVNNVLVLLVDKALEEVRSKRTLNNSMSIFSDGACAFMVCRGAGGHFLLHSVNESTGNQLNGINTTTDFVNYLQRFSAGLKSLSRQVLEEMSLQAEDFKYFIGGNYNLSILKNYAILSGFKPKQLYYPNLKDMAHAYSSDLLITLKTLKKEDLKHGDKLFLLGTGSFHWGASVISYCN